MKSLPTLRRRLADLLPGDEERLARTRTANGLLEIAVEALEFRSDSLSRTGFALGAKIGSEIRRKESAAKGKAEHNRALTTHLAARFEQAYQGFQVHENVLKDATPEKKAKEMAWQQMQVEYQRLTGKPIKIASLKDRLRRSLKGATRKNRRS